jgi:hypothetical protein
VVAAKLAAAVVPVHGGSDVRARSQTARPKTQRTACCRAQIKLKLGLAHTQFAEWTRRRRRLDCRAQIGCRLFPRIHGT